MYNTITEKVIRSAPQIGDIDPERLPQELTKIYARIVTIRRTLTDGVPLHSKNAKRSIKLLRRLASNLETLAVLRKNHPQLRSVAFVAGTAHYLLLLIYNQLDTFFKGEFSEDQIPPAVSAIILFLIGNSPADAAEVAGKVFRSTESHITGQIQISLCLLAQGKLTQILELKPVETQTGGREGAALYILWEKLFIGIQEMAASLLGSRSAQSANYFRQVIDLGTYNYGGELDGLLSYYAGPLHLAKLLDILSEDLLNRGIVNVQAPTGIDAEEWSNFLGELAKDRPYLWENHFDAIDTGFLNPGISAVLTFPTGAGKTTISELKIAATLLSGKSVVYLVPTHALEDQVKRDLNRLFSKLTANIDFDVDAEYTEVEEGPLPIITVMTPERCLTRLSIDSTAFSETGLVVFDEFHLVNGRDDKLERRSMDAMFCLLRLFTEIQDADYLLISAMVENAEEVQKWVEKVTGRPCKRFDSSWKPTRQLHGCVIFPEDEITELKSEIVTAKRTATTSGPPTKLAKQMEASASHIFSLRNIWESENDADYFIKKLLPEKVPLAISPKWKLTSNRNGVAADLAAYFVKQGIKTLVFVDNPKITVSTARDIANKLGEVTPNAEAFVKKHERDLKSLTQELGAIKYSYFNAESPVAVHHGLMLPIERRLNESFFKERQGVHAVTATATLAQGINLPAEIVIIAGYDRFDDETGYREIMQAHEILNAAGRAGRAGSAAQGVVMIIPGEIIKYKNKKVDSGTWDELKDDIFSKGDQCLKINDPLDRFLDRISTADELSSDESNLLFRLNSDRESEAAAEVLFNKSLTAYRAEQNKDEGFADRVKKLIERKDALGIELIYSKWTEIVSLKMGADPEIISALGKSLSETGYQTLFAFDVSDWISWLFSWLDNDPQRITGLFPTKGAQIQLMKALGLNVQKSTTNDVVEKITELEPILLMYVKGNDYAAIDTQIPGKTDAYLIKARNFILKLVPHFSFVFGIISMTLREKCKEDGIEEQEYPYLVKVLATMIREGFDDESQLRLKMRQNWYSRVQYHQYADL
ncbi:DEAD/DEAH box helicase [Mucilaginibacter sp. RCC_168]|uniref:DEAD/DEAH box helicase n=1 Tax=Mucilaginibacter sp. RCC_168 TaxID=3239221 RepID=UPI003523FE74